MWKRDGKSILRIKMNNEHITKTIYIVYIINAHNNTIEKLTKIHWNKKNHLPLNTCMHIFFAFFLLPI